MRKFKNFAAWVKVYLCALLLVSFAPAAMAEHHRSHNLGYYDNVTGDYVPGHIEFIEGYTHPQTGQVVIGHLTKLENLQKSITNTPCANWTPLQLKRLSQLETYTTKLRNNLAVVKDVLENAPIGDEAALVTARHAISQPVPDVFTGVGSNSDNSFVRVSLNPIILAQALIIDGNDPSTIVCPEQARNVGLMVVQAGFVWRRGDLVQWHVIDAYLEEVFENPAQICGGPNNHADTNPVCQ